MTIILEMPAKSFTPHAHSIRSFLTGTTCNLLRVLALGVVGGRVFARPDGRFDV